MDLDTLKDKLDGETLEALTKHITDLTEAKNAARQESIQGRQKLKSENEQYKSLANQLMEKLGISDPTELDTVPAKPLDAVKQYEVQLKSAQKTLAEREAMLNDINAKYKRSTVEAKLASAMKRFDFKEDSADLVESYAMNRVEWIDDEPYLKIDDKLVTISDGVTHIAKTKPSLLNSAGKSGSGFNQPATGAGKTLTREEWNALPAHLKAENVKFLAKS
ncbi:hypothetical protein [Caudoviricetes sp.]|nr:hypothetical protein [Caudoviricetes sp.]